MIRNKPAELRHPVTRTCSELRVRFTSENHNVKEMNKTFFRNFLNFCMKFSQFDFSIGTRRYGIDHKQVGDSLPTMP